MNEKELVKWFALSLVEGLKAAEELAAKAETLDDLRTFETRLSDTGIEVTNCILMMEHYLTVHESIMNKDKEDPE